MMTDRGIIIEKFDELNEINVFDTVLLIFIENDKLGVQHVKNIEKHTEEQKKLVNILIYKNGITSFAKNAIKDLKVKVECFSYNELTYNVTKHKLVPTHKILSVSEKKDVLQKFLVKESNLPLILSNDPIVRYFNAKPGTLFEITRNSNTTVNSTFYRLVV